MCKCFFYHTHKPYRNASVEDCFDDYYYIFYEHYTEFEVCYNITEAFIDFENLTRSETLYYCDTGCGEFLARQLEKLVADCGWEVVIILYRVVASAPGILSHMNDIRVDVGVSVT